MHVHQLEHVTAPSRRKSTFNLMGKGTNLGMFSLMFILLYQIILVYGDSKHSVRIRRVVLLDKEGDSFELPLRYEWCSRHNACSRFDANLSQTAFKLRLCKCSCSRQKASTFSLKNGQWQCIDNKEIRERELDGKLVLLLCNMLIYMYIRQIRPGIL